MAAFVLPAVSSGLKIRSWHGIAVPRRQPRMSAPARTFAPGRASVPVRASGSSSVSDQVVRVAAAAADAAREITTLYYRSPALGVDFKSDASPVTEADRRAERAMRAIIVNALPGHTVLGEEDGGMRDGNAEYTWVLDPIDGTKAFIAGKPTFGTLIAVLDSEGVPVYGVIDQPVSDERWEGGIGRPTTLNGQPVRVKDRYPSTVATVEEAASLLGACVVFATHPAMFAGLDALAFRSLEGAVKHVMYGCDCYAYALLASGYTDMVVEADLKLWDFAALVPVVSAAGGVITDWAGDSLDIDSDGRVVAAASPLMHELALRQLQSVLDQKDVQSTLPADPGPGHVESMTGFGEGVAHGDGEVSVSVQLRSVNSRYCDVQYRGPRFLAPFEAEFTAIIKRALNRGKVIFTVTIDSASDSSSEAASDDAAPGGDVSDDLSPRLNEGSAFNPRAASRGNSRAGRGKLSLAVDEDAVGAARSMLDQVASAAGIESKPTISDILTFSDIFVKADTGNGAEEVAPVVKRALEVALDRLLAARRREGTNLEQDLTMRCTEIDRILNEIETRAPSRLAREHERLKERVAAVGVEPDTLIEGRVEQEIALLAARLDITEEIVRLRSHVHLFKLTFRGVSEPVGQRLMFMLQEMNREATTIASKSNDAPIAQLSVLVKQEIEKIREQAANLC